MGTRQAATSASTTSTHATRRPRSRHVGRIDGSVITVAPTQGPHPIRVGRPCPGYGTPASTRAARGRRPRGTAGRWRQRYHPRCGMPDPNSRYARWSSASPQPHPDQVATQERIDGNGQRERSGEQAPHCHDRPPPGPGWQWYVWPSRTLIDPLLGQFWPFGLLQPPAPASTSRSRSATNATIGRVT